MSESGSAEEFFYNNRKPSCDSAGLLNETSDKQTPQLVQPRSRYQFPVVQSLVVEQKRKSEDAGLPALRINRSGTNLSALNVHIRSNSATSESGNRRRSRSSGSRIFLGFSFANNSNSSLAIAEENEEDGVALADDLPFGENLDDDADERLVPYGGFSRPDLESTFMDQRSVFEVAPWQVVRSDQGNGSLYNAVKSAREKGVVEKCKWVGALSLPTDAIPKGVLEKVTSKLSKEYNCEPVIVNDLTFQGHYKSFCKQILWPTLHYQIPDDPKSKAFEDHSYHYYKLLNQSVADKIVETYNRENKGLDPSDPENMIWIHDYHLLLVPQMVRQQLPGAKIGFFLHVSFPSSEVFRCLAQRKSLLQGMLGADCITFQTEEYVRHFLQTCNRLVLSDSNESGLIHDGSYTKVNTIPVGIEADDLKKVLKSESVVEWKNMIRDRWKGKILVVSRDQLDKLRGVKQKLLAYEKFLIDNPEYVNKTSLIQIFIGSSDDLDYEAEIMQISSRINSLTENISDTPPVVILNKDIHFEQYIALQSEADVFIVSSMREGLNLTCHEYIVATHDKKSPLLLSEFTGSSHLLSSEGNGAILINPWDRTGFCNAIKMALSMGDEEKGIRWKNCYDIVTKHDSLSWIKSCLRSINQGWKRGTEKSSTNMNPFTSAVFEKFYLSATGARLFFLNLDTPGTNATLFGGQPGAAKGFLDFSRVGNLLKELASDPSNHVYVSSIIKRSELELLFKNMVHIGLVAEGGGFIKFIGQSKWMSTFDEEEINNWKPQASLFIKAKAERLPGSLAVIEDCTLRLLVAASVGVSESRFRDILGGIILYVNDAFGSAGVHATFVNNSVVIQKKDIALRTIKLLLTYYTTEIDAEGLTKRMTLRPVNSTLDAIFNGSQVEPNDQENENKGKIVSSLFFSGGLNPTDEAVYEFAKTLTKDQVVEDALTVSVCGDQLETRTSATYTALGQNELLSIISKV